jgi:hypothetical protein
LSVSINSKASIGVGAFGILTGAVCLWIDLEIWGTYIGLILLGMFLILDGISFNLGGRGQKVISGLCYGFAGIGLVFLVIGLVSLLWS